LSPGRRRYERRAASVGQAQVIYNNNNNIYSTAIGLEPGGRGEKLRAQCLPGGF